MLSSSRINPVVDPLADLALWEAELVAVAGSVDAVAAGSLSVASSLLDRLRQVLDPRRLRGLRHPLLVILVLTASPRWRVGNDSVTAIRQWAAGTPQDVLHRLGARYHPLRGRYTVPSERTFRRVLAGLTVMPSTRRPAATPLTLCVVTHHCRSSPPAKTNRPNGSSAALQRER